MKIIFVCFYEAYPPASGAASVTYNCAKHAQGQRWLIQVAGPTSGEETSDGISVYTVQGAAGRLTKLAGLRQRVKQIIALCKAIGPDVVVLEGASWVVYHLALLRKLRKEQPGVTIVYHAHNVEYTLRRQKHGRLVCAITRWAEARLLQECDQAFAVSDVDRAQLKDLYGVDTLLLPNGVDVDRFERVSPDDVTKVRQRYAVAPEWVLFMGFYEYLPNREAVDFLIDKVFPRVVQQRPTARLVIVGGHVPHHRSWLLNPGTIPYGHLHAMITACRVGVAPIFSGSGTRLKILEYLMAGLPVVATAKGAEGLDVEHGKGLLLAENADQFAEHVLKLLEDPQRASDLGEQGQQVVRQRYSYDSIMHQFGEAVNSRTIDAQRQPVAG